MGAVGAAVENQGNCKALWWPRAVERGRASNREKAKRRVIAATVGLYCQLLQLSVCWSVSSRASIIGRTRVLTLRRAYSVTKRMRRGGTFWEPNISKWQRLVQSWQQKVTGSVSHWMSRRLVALKRQHVHYW